MGGWHHSRKYEVDESFFSKWSPEMAYVFGYWSADGYMRKEKSYRISITSADAQILRDVRDVMSSTHPLKADKKRKYWTLSICSKRLYGDLSSLGGYRRKSRTLTLPKIPKQYLRDFIRGYFDGDGSVFFVNYTRSKDGKAAKELRTNFTSGSRVFLEQLMLLLRTELGLSVKKLGVFNEGASLKLGYGTRDSDALLHYMYYKRFPIGLGRKADFLNKIPAYQKHFPVEK